jgi:hypothetical protein
MTRSISFVHGFEAGANPRQGLVGGHGPDLAALDVGDASLDLWDPRWVELEVLVIRIDALEEREPQPSPLFGGKRKGFFHQLLGRVGHEQDRKSLAVGTPAERTTSALLRLQRSARHGDGSGRLRIDDKDAQSRINWQASR